LLSSKKTEYKVYRFLLEVFAPKLAEVFQRGVRAIKLDNITPPAFEVFISWLKYSFHRHTDGSHPNEIAAKIPNDHLIQSEYLNDGCSDFSINDDDPLSFGIAGESSCYGKVAIELFIFAAQFDIHRLRNDTIDRLRRCFEGFHYTYDGASWDIDASSVCLAYDSTEPGSPLRIVLVRGFCIYTSAKHEEHSDFLSAMPHEFLVDLAKEYKMMMKPHELGNCYRQVCKSLEPSCEFHEHKTEPEKALCELDRQ
jgi:hypothetical protein